MNRLIVAGLTVLMCAHAPAASATSIAPTLACVTGPITKTFGGTQWWVSSCSDEASIAFVSAPGNPARPYVFILSPKGDEYDLRGEGKGAPSAIDAAAADLRRLTREEIAAIIAETKAIPRVTPTSP